ncbi:metal-dependent hydrolase [Paraperlucidibaca wandonensis]|uniref:Metal-dependent hydrolase n=1 Tax=Paraperlucidibaca wandonensis TaxID=1268273 RepID=A0ABW3HI56_9GAMM
MTAFLGKVSAISSSLAAILPIRRDLRFNLPADRVLDWHPAGGPGFAAFLNTFSLFLPVGERFFIDSVREYRDQIHDPELKKAITAFIGQEAMHGREHEEMNDALFAVVPIAPKIERFVKNALDTLGKYFGKEMSLSGTIALEHFTALLADSILREPRLMAGAEPHYAALWRWHALEETEHKAVAFDTWTAVMGRGPRAYAMRATGMVLATAIFWLIMMPALLAVLRSGGHLTDLKSMRKLLKFTMGEYGIIRIQLRDYIDYFRPSFHPWDHDNRKYLLQIDDFLAEQERLGY